MEINPAQLHAVEPLKPTVGSKADQAKSAQKLHDAYLDFVGKTFFGQMLKAMRSTVDKPAYFHGGQAEEVFRSQLDQQLADNLSAATAEQIAEPMFRHQFPQQAGLLADQKTRPTHDLTSLDAVRRR